MLVPEASVKASDAGVRIIVLSASVAPTPTSVSTFGLDRRNPKSQ